MAEPASDPVQHLVEVYRRSEHLVRTFMSQLLSALDGSSGLQEQIHSMRSRLKDPTHLRDKLQRKVAQYEAAGELFDITEDNLLTRITDLASIRLLHLYTQQFRAIDGALRAVLREQNFALVEDPFARTWDDEYREYFRSCGITTQSSPSMYTSVHYVVGSASRTPVTCEIQVRTLMEEVWGEVDHRLNYPLRTSIHSTQEQLKVLARVTSSATRLVDSIFATHERLSEGVGSPASGEDRSLD